jgi:hypothetical protein
MDRDMPLAFSLVAFHGCACCAWQDALAGVRMTPLDQQPVADAWISLATCVSRVMNAVTVH